MEHIYAKKSLGQNFLKSKGAIREIIKAANIQPTDTILEVGPGKGALTESLLEKAGKVVVVEKDDRIIPFLQEKFPEQIANGKLVIVYGDALEFSPESQGLELGKYKIVANIPYYITGQFLRLFLEHGAQPSLMVLMLQKEVAKRIVARDEKESILSISVKAYGTPVYVDTVAAKYFSPPPKVDSAILLIKDISKSFFADVSQQSFFELVKKGFHHKRKMLAQNLEIPTEEREKVFGALGINIKARAEDLALSDWKQLTTHLSRDIK